MAKPPMLHGQPSYVRIIFFGVLLMGCFSFFSVLALFLTSHLFPGVRLNPDGLPIPLHGNTLGIAAFRLMQGINSIGLFLFPPLLLARFIDPKPLASLGLKGKIQGRTVLLGMLLVVVAIPFINWMAEINSEIQLPAFLSSVEEWMRSRESTATIITETFMNVTSISALMANLVVVAVIPGIGEELFFRGVLQPFFAGDKNRNHFAIWFTAFIFAALHMQFFSFFPRFFLGVFLGYLYLHTQRLWVPILVHFFNNAFAVILSFISFNYFSPGQLDKAGCRTSEWALVATSAALTGMIVYLIFWRKKKAGLL
ncbi:MAG: CPBP family intramembrane glutamic endopeptidase [Bacteroidota bacterium]